MFSFLKTLKVPEKVVPAIFDDDLKGVLTAIQKLEDVENGRCVCKICGSTITLKSIQFIIPQKSGAYEWVCNDPKCVEAFSGNTPVV